MLGFAPLSSLPICTVSHQTPFVPQFRARSESGPTFGVRIDMSGTAEQSAEEDFAR